MELIIFYFTSLKNNIHVHQNLFLKDFIITGVQKCGTTGLLHFLKGNPYLIAVPGEAHYFDSFINYPKGPAWYMALMPSVHEYHRVYEKTPSYMTLKKVPAKIFNFDSKMKLIAVLCDPVKLKDKIKKSEQLNLWRLQAD